MCVFVSAKIRKLCVQALPRLLQNPPPTRLWHLVFGVFRFPYGSSPKKGAPIWTPLDFHPYYGHAQKVSLILGSPRIHYAKTCTHGQEGATYGVEGCWSRSDISTRSVLALRVGRPSQQLSARMLHLDTGFPETPCKTCNVANFANWRVILTHH